MSLFEELSENVIDVVNLGLTAGVGYGVYKLGSSLNLTDQQKQIKDIVALGIVGYGAYRFARNISPPELPDDLLIPFSFPIIVLKPRPGQDLSSLVPHIFKATVANPYDREYTIYVGHSLYTPTGNILDRPVERVTIPAHSSRTISKTIYLELNQLGDWKVRYSAWNKYPTVAATNLMRIGDSGWVNFELSII